MHIALYGATGNSGSRILTELLSRGHEVTAIARTPSKLSANHSKIVQRLDVPWLLRQNLLVKLLRLLEPPGVMVLHRQIECLLNGELRHAEWLVSEGVSWLQRSVARLGANDPIHFTKVYIIKAPYSRCFGC